MSNFHRDDWNEDWAIVDGAGYHDIQVQNLSSIYLNLNLENPRTSFLILEQYESCLDLKFSILFIIVPGIGGWTCCIC